MQRPGRCLVTTWRSECQEREPGDPLGRPGRGPTSRGKPSFEAEELSDRERSKTECGKAGSVREPQEIPGGLGKVGSRNSPGGGDM